MFFAQLRQQWMKGVPLGTILLITLNQRKMIYVMIEWRWCQRPKYIVNEMLQRKINILYSILLFRFYFHPFAFFKLHFQFL